MGCISGKLPGMPDIPEVPTDKIIALVKGKGAEIPKQAQKQIADWKSEVASSEDPVVIEAKEAGGKEITLTKESTDRDFQKAAIAVISNGEFRDIVKGEVWDNVKPELEDKINEAPEQFRGKVEDGAKKGSDKAADKALDELFAKVQEKIESGAGFGGEGGDEGEEKAPEGNQA